jgi:hypothetical protein
MKTFLILFKTGSIPFSSSKKDDYIKEWHNYLNSLKELKILESCFFLKKDGINISGKKIVIRSYVPHKDIFSGFFIVKANNFKEVTEISKSCPVFKRNGDIQIKEIDQNYLNYN